MNTPDCNGYFTTVHTGLKTNAAIAAAGLILVTVVLLALLGCESNST